MFLIKDIKFFYSRKEKEKFSLNIDELRLNKGEYLLLYGENGAGKTTLAKIIAGFLKPISGKIFLKDRDITHLSPEYRNIGLFYGGGFLFPHLKVKDNLSFGLRFRKFTKKEKKEKYEKIVETLYLNNITEKYPNSLSMGEYQRVALGRAIIIEPSILILDEPFSHQDSKIKEEMNSLLYNLLNTLHFPILHLSANFKEEKPNFSYTTRWLKGGNLI